jgi:ketosteroid isomerase-like protein
MKLLTWLAAAAVLLIGTANAQTPSAEVTSAANAIVAAFGRHDPKAYFAQFAPEATFVFYTTDRRLNSRAEYEAEWAKWEKEDAFHVESCRSTDQRVQLLGDVAVFSHSVETSLTTRQGPATVHERETIVFQRQDGKWVAVHEHLSPRPEVPPAATEPATK